MGGAGAMFAGPQVKAIGGNIMAHSTTTRLYLRKVLKYMRALDMSSLQTLHISVTFFIQSPAVGRLDCNLTEVLKKPIRSTKM